MRAPADEVAAAGYAEEEGRQDRHRIVALSRGLHILRAFEQAAGPLSSQDLVAFTGLPKSTVSRLTRTLAIEGFLVQLPRTAQYQLAPTVVGLARAYHHGTGVVEVARSHLQELATQVRATVAVGAPEGVDMVYLAIARGVSHIKVPLDPGTRVPIGATAVGLACLHALPVSEREALLAALRKSHPLDADRLDVDVERTGSELERYGFCVYPGTWRPDMNGVGVPLVLPDQTVIAFNVGGPAFWLKEEKMYADVGPRLVAMVRNFQADFSRHGGGAR